jgi:hypothetical protein
MTDMTDGHLVGCLLAPEESLGEDQRKAFTRRQYTPGQEMTN